MSKKDHTKAVERGLSLKLFVRMLVSMVLAVPFLWLPQVIPYEDSFFLSIAMLLLLVSGIVFLAMGLFWLWCLVAGRTVVGAVVKELNKPLTIRLEPVKNEEE